MKQGGQALQGNWEEAGKLALKGAGDVVGAASTISLTVGTVALAVGTGGSSLAALSVAGTAFTVAK